MDVETSFLVLFQYALAAMFSNTFFGVFMQDK